MGLSGAEVEWGGVGATIRVRAFYLLSVFNPQDLGRIPFPLARTSFPSGAPWLVSEQVTSVEVVKVGGILLALLASFPPCPAGWAPRVWGGCLTYVLAPGEGQGWVNGSRLLLRGRRLVTIVPGLFRGEHVHL